MTDRTRWVVAVVMQALMCQESPRVAPAGECRKTKLAAEGESVGHLVDGIPSGPARFGGDSGVRVGGVGGGSRGGGEPAKEYAQQNRTHDDDEQRDESEPQVIRRAQSWTPE